MVRNLLASLQWMLFILMGSIVIPVAIAGQYGFPQEEIIAFVARSIFVLGIAGILQVLFGHRLPIQEGPAGVWWGVFTLYAGIGTAMFGSQSETLRVFEFCFILSGIVFIILALLRVVEKIAKLFTPTVMGAYLILLVVQLSGAFLKGMVGLSSTSAHIDPGIALLSIVTIACAYYLRRFKGLGTYATLFSIVIGWLLFIIFGKAPTVSTGESWFSFPAIFAFGMPRIEHSMIVNVICLTLLLLTNMVASVRVVQITFDALQKKYEHRLNQTSAWSGIIHIISGVFGAIGPVPISGSAAFITQTKITDRLPFILGNVLIILLGLSPAITAYFAALPIAVGFASLVPTFGIGTIMIALSQIESAGNKANRNLTVGASWFAGISVMFLPASAFEGLPPLITSVLGNGLIVGAMVALVLDHFFPSVSQPNAN